MEFVDQFILHFPPVRPKRYLCHYYVFFVHMSINAILHLEASVEQQTDCVIRIQNPLFTVIAPAQARRRHRVTVKTDRNSNKFKKELRNTLSC